MTTHAMTTDAVTADCPFCARHAAGRPEIGDWVLRRDHVSACVMPGLDIPGWYVLHLNEHVEGLGLMTEEQAGAIGNGARELTAAITAVTGEPRVYAYTICENAPHFHMVMGTPPSSASVRGRDLLVEILNREPGYVDAAATRRVADQVRRAVAAGGPPST